MLSNFLCYFNSYDKHTLPVVRAKVKSNLKLLIKTTNEYSEKSNNETSDVS